VKPQIAILGAGMAGFGAAYRLHNEGVRSIQFEKNSYYGGHAATFKNDNGFIFDDGPHISFTKNERIQKLFAESVNEEYEKLQAQVNNYWKGHWVKHPAQCNLSGLPDDLVVDVLKDFIGVYGQEHGEIKNYADWLVSSFGKTFATTFPMEYGWKYHTTTASNMSIDWLGERLYQPKLEEVLRGAITSLTPEVHYISHFRYPTHDGFVSYLNMFLDNADLRLDNELQRINPKSRELYFSNGGVIQYDAVISSIPLPEFMPRIDGVPKDVLEAAEQLACTTCVIVNIGLKRENISPAHWTYFYDRDICFSRLSFPHMFSSNNVPQGHGSIQAEVYYSKKYRPLDCKPEDCIDRVINDLQKCGLLAQEDEIVFREARVASYANVIFDLDRAKALEIVHGYLDDIKIAYCGRFGDWGYLWTDESFVSGENAAQKIINRI
jgi:protoporphyrinogen oxidase